MQETHAWLKRSSVTLEKSEDIIVPNASRNSVADINVNTPNKQSQEYYDT